MVALLAACVAESLTARLAESVTAWLACCRVLVTLLFTCWVAALVAPLTAWLAELEIAWVALCCRLPTMLPSREVPDPVIACPTPLSAVAVGLPACHSCMVLGQVGVAAVRFSPNT